MLRLTIFCIITFFIFSSCSEKQEFQELILKKKLIEPFVSYDRNESDSSITFFKKNETSFPLGAITCKAQHWSKNGDFLEFHYTKPMESREKINKITFKKTELVRITIQAHNSGLKGLREIENPDSLITYFQKKWNNFDSTDDCLITFYSELQSNKYQPLNNEKTGSMRMFSQRINSSGSQVFENNSYTFVNYQTLLYLKRIGLVSKGDTLIHYNQKRKQYQRRKIKDWSTIRDYFIS